MLKQNRQYFILSMTVLLIASGFLAYFFIYLPQQKQRVDGRHFRVLAKIGDNAVEMARSYRKNAWATAKNVLEDTNVVNAGQVNKMEFNRSLRTKYVFNKHIKYGDFKRLDPNDSIRSSTGLYSLKSFGGAYHLFCNDTVTVVSDAETVVYSYSFSFETNNFFQQLQRPDQFKEHLIIKGNKVIYPSPHNGLQVVNEDTLLLASGGIKTSTVADVNVSGVDRKLFLQPLKVSNGIWMIGGMVDADDYYTSKRSVSTYLLVLISVLLLLGILSFPFLKLQLLSDCERLNRSDVLLSGASLVFGTALVTLMCFHVRTLNGPHFPIWHPENDLVELSETIQNRLHRELTLVLKEIHMNDTELRKLIGDLGVASKKLSVPDPTMILGVDHVYPGFNQQSWIREDDSSVKNQRKGDQIHKWAAPGELTARINVSKRDYFWQLAEDRGWLFPNVKEQKFYLESIRAWNSGRSEAAISTYSKHLLDEALVPNIIAMTTELKSLTNTVLPSGFGFCILDTAGETLFHSRSSLNLQEDFLKETDHCNDLEAAIYARRSQHCDARYHGKHYRMFITPLWSTPLFLVTFHQRGGLHAAYTQTLSFSAIMFLIYIVLACVQLAVIAISLSRKSKLQSSQFVFHWLWPDKKKTHRYVTVMLYHIVMFIFLGACQSYLPSPTMKFSVILYSVFPLIIGSYFILHAEIVHWRDRKVKLFLLLPLTISLLTLSGIWIYECQQWPWYVLAFWIVPLILISGAPLFYIRKNTLNKVFVWRPPSKWHLFENHSYSYISMMISWLFLGAVMPIMFFFSLSYDQEIKMLVKVRQHEFANALEKKGITDFTTNNGLKDNQPSNLEVNYLGIIPLQRDVVNSRGDTNSGNALQLNPDLSFQKIYSYLRAPYNKLIASTNGLVVDQCESHSAEHWRLHEDHLKYTRELGDNRNMVISSDLIAFDPIGFSWSSSEDYWYNLKRNSVILVFWLLVPMLITLLYYLIRFTLRQSFAQEILEGEFYNDHTIEVKMLTHTTRHIFLAGLPYSGKSSFIHRNVNGSSFNLISYLGMSEAKKQEYLLKCLNESEGTIVIDHFEHRINELSVNRVKLELLEDLIVKYNQRIIIASSYEIWCLFDSYVKLEKLSKQPDLTEEQLVHLQYLPDFDRWRNTLNKFVRLYLSLHRNKPAKDDEYLRILVAEECSHGSFLESLYESVLDYAMRLSETSDSDNKYKRLPHHEENVILKIQSLAQSHYHTLWSTCSSREKLLIYDLAEDDFINVKNAQNVSGLLKKGLLKSENGRLKIMNRSFKNFVLTTIDRDDALQKELSQVNKGTWSGFRTPLILILVGMAAFIFIAERGSFNTIITLLGSFATALMVGVRAFDTLGSIAWKRGTAKK